MADALAALGIISRRGLGKVRHFDTTHLWIRDASANKRTNVDKALEISNVVGLCACTSAGSLICMPAPNAYTYAWTRTHAHAHVHQYVHVRSQVYTFAKANT